MAFGDIKGTKTGSATSITASFACATGTNFAVVVGDLIVTLCAEQAAKTVTACTDNLTNTYTALGVGADAGTVTGRGFYTRVTNAGTISSVTFTATASSNNCVGLAVGFEGPFAVSPLDANPTTIINDNTTPYTCPPTGTLAQADEKIVCAIVHNGNPTLTATAPNIKAVELATASILKAALGHQTVSSTSSVTPAWTSSATPTASGYATVSFKKTAPTSGDGDADGIAGAIGGGGAINGTPGTAGGVAAATAVGVAASIYSAEADQFFARTTGLTSERKALYNTYINALVAGGVWAKLQCHYLFAAPDAATAVVNLKSSSFPGTVNGSPVFTVDAGFAGTVSGSATTQFIDTGYKPSVHGAQNDQHISVWNGSNQAEAHPLIGCRSSTGLTTFLQIWPKYSVDNNAYYYCHMATAPAAVTAIGDPRGLHITTSSGAGAQETYFNGTARTGGGTTREPADYNVYVLGQNYEGAPYGSTCQARSASIGTRLTAAEASAFYNAQYAFLAALETGSAGTATGVAAAAAEGRCIIPAASAGGGGDWTTVFQPEDLRQINPGWVGYTIVGVIPLANLSATGGTQARLTFLAPWGGEGAEYSAFYIGNGGGGDPYDFGDTPVQVTVSGSATISVPVNAATGVVVSDAVAFTKDASNSLVFAAQFSNASADNAVYSSDTATGSTYYKGGTEAALANKSGYTGLSVGVPFVFKVELFSGGAAGVAGIGGALAVGAIGEPASPTTGSAVGVGAAAASAAAITTGASSAPGVGTAAADGRQIVTRIVTAAGVGATTAAGAQTAGVTGTASGVGAAAAVGDVGSAAVSATGSAAGIGAATAQGAQTASASGAATGIGGATALSSGAAIASATGTAAGVGAAAATGRQVITVAGAASGFGTAAATGGKIATAQGAAAGLGIASGSSSAAAYVSGVGAASGIGAASAVGFAHSAAAAGTAAGQGAAAATGQKIATATGAVAGIGAAAATSGAIKAAAGAASGIGAAAATGFEAAVVFGEAAGSASAVGTVSGIGFAILPSATPGDRVTEIPFVPRGGSVPASMRGAAVAGSRRIAAVAGHSRIAIVPRRDRAA